MPFLSCLLASLLILATAVSAVNDDSEIIHTVTYQLDGTIDLKKHVGHFCNSGAEMKQVITGQGFLTKATDLTMPAKALYFDDNNDWTTAEEAIRNLVVTTAIKLCSPAKHTYRDNGRVVVVPDRDLYRAIDRETYDPEVMEPLTDQIWAVSVEAFAGQTGFVNTDFDAAFRVSRSRPFRGDLFNIEQTAGTSQGVTRRFIDISSAVSHGYIYENMIVTGRSEIKESLEMLNYRARPAKEEPEWDWDHLF